eukprot:CAMPEP_0194371848 /NCGR_PEP_ID=MMETSP0174-20130528/20221_1 /TAXON_ID=216777 /ORGANISM="Proboscia alata, Strain PI-D3" /LENGTH=414 /DNA_ID=CAMNT_0039150085 /DNA_START=9 /DNA_END=1253 /DNA_ORIENTATION=-
MVTSALLQHVFITTATTLLVPSWWVSSFGPQLTRITVPPAFVRPLHFNTVNVRQVSPLTTLQMSTSLEDPSSDNKRVANEARAAKLFHSTPLILSDPLTALLNSGNNTKPRNVYLKMDALQTSGSFKDRGVAHLCQTLHASGTTKLISSSGGNAGLAVATVGKALGMTVQVIVPETTKPMVLEKLRGLGASVQIHGVNWNAADVLARDLVEQDSEAEYVSPYENPLLWTGHSTLIDEIVEDLGVEGIEGATVVASVGGGGLLCGILEGLQRHSLHETTVIAAETTGAASFGTAFSKGEPVMLDAINTIATSLGALQVSDSALERAKAHIANGGSVVSGVCTDAEAIDACVKFADQHRLLVEPACGAGLAVLYSDRLRKELFNKDKNTGPVIIEVCGGSGVNLELLDMWKTQFSL